MIMCHVLVYTVTYIFNYVGFRNLIIIIVLAHIFKNGVILTSIEYSYIGDAYRAVVVS